MTWQQELGTQIRKARQAAGLTQAKLAERSHVSRQMIGRYETGGDPPSVKILAQIARVLNIREIEVQGLRVRIDEPEVRGRPRLVGRQLDLPYDRPHLFKGASVRIVAHRRKIILTAVLPA